MVAQPGDAAPAVFAEICPEPALQAEIPVSVFTTLVSALLAFHGADVCNAVFALIREESFADVTYAGFLAHFAPLSTILVLMAYRWRASGSFRPFDAKILSWEAALFLFARWPWALAGAVAAVRDWLTGSFVDFRITPKGTSQVDPLPRSGYRSVRRFVARLHPAGTAH